jgi:hypothetical protein
MTGGANYCFFIQYTIPARLVHPHMNATAFCMTDSTTSSPWALAGPCPYCASEVELVTGGDVYPERPELADRKIWRCTCCDAYVGCYRSGARVVLRGGEEVISDGTLPMGSLANEELRAARIETHRMFDALTLPPALMARRDAYAWMGRLLNVPTEEAHIASLTYDECVKVQLAIEDLQRPPGQAPELMGAAYWLLQAGISFTTEPDGHLVVKAGAELIDYWPDRHTWSVRGELLGEEQAGFHGLILFCRRHA